MFYGWHLGKAHLEQILKDGIMMAGLGVVTGIKHSNMWKCKQGLWAWKTEAAMPQQRSPKRCLLVMPRKCHGVDKWGMQSLMDSKQKEIPSGSLQRGLSSSNPGGLPLIRLWWYRQWHRISGRHADLHRLETFCDHTMDSWAKSKGAWKTEATWNPQ